MSPGYSKVAGFTIPVVLCYIEYDKIFAVKLLLK